MVLLSIPILPAMQAFPRPGSSYDSHLCCLPFPAQAEELLPTAIGNGELDDPTYHLRLVNASSWDQGALTEY